MTVTFNFEVVINVDVPEMTAEEFDDLRHNKPKEFEILLHDMRYRASEKIQDGDYYADDYNLTLEDWHD